MRVSPAPPSSAAPPHHHHHPHHSSSHMSPAVGGPSCSSSGGGGGVVLGSAGGAGHPSSGGADARNSPNMHAPPYPPNGPHHPPPPHGYPSKMAGHMPPTGPPYGQPGAYQQPGSLQYPGARPQGPSMHPYPQNFPPGGPQPQQGPPSSMPPSHQYPPRPPHSNHAPPSQYGQYPHYGGQQGWAPSMGQGPPPSNVMGGAMGAKGQHPGQPGQPGGGGGLPRPHTPPHYLKQHLHQKMGVYGPSGGPPTNSGPQMYPNGPGLPPGMSNNRDSPVSGMGAGGGQNNMPPPTSTPGPMDIDGSNPPPPPAIGPDGNPVLDDASQQSTLSNTSAASGDDRSLTPKPPHKEPGMPAMMSGGTMLGPGGPMGPGAPVMGGGQGPPMQYASSPHAPLNSSHSHPHNSAPSPGSTSMSSDQPEFDNMNSPGWPRSPSTQQQPPSTVFGSSQQPPPPPDIYRPTKADNIARLYEMSDSPERRQWLDKLLAFMEENKTPINACPTISKNPLDLYALYLHVKERGGFSEVTKNKQWKDVAAVMGIGASSSGSYTLRKHYMKHILFYECRFDRGGIDPQPIINQIEASAKKKTTKVVSVPSPGSSNSQDSFPPAASNNSMDGYSNGPPHPGMPPYPPYPPSGDYPSHMQQRPPSQSQPGYQGYQGNQYPGYQGMHSGYSQGGYPPTSGYPPDNRSYQGPPPPGPPNHQGSYQGYQQPGYQRAGGYPPPPPSGQQGYQQDQYSPGAAASPGPPGSSGGAPSSQAYQGPRRHPDFEKQPQPQPTSPQQQPPSAGWRGGSQPYPGYGGQSGPAGVPPQQPWSRPNDGSVPPPPPGAPTNQWGPPSRYPPPPPVSSQSFTSPSRWSGGSYTTGPPPRTPAPGVSKSFIVPPPTSFKSSGYGAYMGKQLFPVDSVEAVLPVLPRRKRMARHHLPSINPWSLLMALRCGLAAEVTWALDVLNILLFDDQTVVYFGLSHMPGLLDSLLEHWRRGLINMFDICEDLEPDEEDMHTTKRVKSDSDNLPWYASVPRTPSPMLKSPSLEMADTRDKTVMLPSGHDYTLISKTGKPVKIVKREPDQFITDAMRGDTHNLDSSGGEQESKMSSAEDFVVIGRTEATSHVICSMQSRVPPLPFTRLLSGKCDTVLLSIKQTIKQDKQKKDEFTFSPFTSALATNKEEKHVVVKSEVVAAPIVPMLTSTDVLLTETEIKKEVKETPTKIVESSKPAGIPIVKDPCNSPKDVVLSISNYTAAQKLNRLSKTSKLDAILKRIKKEPVGATSDILQVGDAKSQLDMLVGNIDSSTNNLTNHNSNISSNTSNTAQDNCDSEREKSASTLQTDKVDTISATPVDVVIEQSEDKVCKEKEQQKKIEDHDVDVKKLKLEEKSIVVMGRKRNVQEVEEEAWSPDEASLCITSEAKDWLARRVLCTGSVLRNLSFIPGNDEIMGKNPAMMALLGRTILLHHEHPTRAPTTPHYDREDDADIGDWCSSLATDTQWWWPYLHHLHEACLVTLCNLSGHLDLSQYPEEITRPVLSGLLHWATCPASYGQDPLPSGGGSPQSALSPQRLALEALVKLCVQDQNTDLVLATPPFTRLERLCSQLTRMLCRGEDQVLREFSINLLHYFSAADTGVARLITMQNGAVSLLVAFIEEAESAAMNVANMQGVNALKENPELMGTSLDMVRRAANTLVHLSKVPENSRILATCENRLLNLVMSQILDTYVASQLSQVLFNMAQVKCEFRPPSPLCRSPLSSSAGTAVSVSVTAAVVPPPSPLNLQGGPQETPVLVAALADYTRVSSPPTNSCSSNNDTSGAGSNGSSTRDDSAASTPASNGTAEKSVSEPMETDVPGPLTNAPDDTIESKEIISNTKLWNALPESNTNAIVTDCPGNELKQKLTSGDHNCTPTVNHTEKKNYSANNVDFNCKDDNEGTNRRNQFETDHSDKIDTTDKREKDKVTSVNSCATNATKSVAVNEIVNSSVTLNSQGSEEAMECSVPAVAKTVSSDTLGCDGVKQGSVLATETPAMPSS